MKKIFYIFILIYMPTFLFGQIDIMITAPGTYGTNPANASMEIAIQPSSVYSFPPAAAEFNLILYAPIADLTGSETFSILENNVNNGVMNWDETQNFDYNGNRYFVFTYSGTGIDLSAYDSGSFQLALTISVGGGTGTTNFCIADSDSDIFSEYTTRTALNLSGTNELQANATNNCLTDVPLPIELLDFKANVTNKSHALINWITSTKENFSHFELERSIDAKDWTVISTINDKSTPNEFEQYNYLDRNVFSILNKNTLYYRLKMVDNDNSFKYSKVVSVNVKDISRQNLSIYPNPASTNINITHDFNIEEKGVISVLDTQGKTIYQTAFLIKNKTDISINIPRLPKGIYLFKIENASESWVEKIVIE